MVLTRTPAQARAAAPAAGGAATPAPRGAGVPGGSGVPAPGCPLRLPPGTLAGVALGAVMDGISGGIRLVRPRAFDYLRFWDVGSLAGRPLEVATTILPFVLAGTVLALVVARSLNAVALGDDLARTLGARI